MKIRPVGAELFHADGQTDGHTYLIVAFRSFANAPKKIKENLIPQNKQNGDRGSTEVKVLCYKSEGRWFSPSWCQWIFH